MRRSPFFPSSRHATRRRPSPSSPCVAAAPRRRLSSVPNTSDRPVRLRFAPSPTGFLHLGGLRTALYNHLLARKLGGKWVLRVEDTDQTRYVDNAVESLLATLRWAKLDYDEGPDRPGDVGPYVQSERRKIYDKYRDTLLDSGHAYRCFCSPDRLVKMREDLKKSGSHATYDRKCLHLSDSEVQSRIRGGESSVVRLKSPDVPMIHQDLVYGSIRFGNTVNDDTVLIKADGMPTYHFANVVDDHEMQISHVLRGEEWLTSTAKHLNLYHALGLDPPAFAHLPLLINPDGSKLSKRSGDVRVEDYMNQGYEPEALLNFVALMGMSHATGPAVSASDAKPSTDNHEVLDMDALINAFSIEAITKHRSTMDPPKLTFLNRHHLARKIAAADEGIVSEAQRLAIARNGENEYTKDETYVKRVLDTIRERLHVLRDFENLTPYFFVEPNLSTPEAEALQDSVDPELYRLAVEHADARLMEVPKDEFTHEAVMHALHRITEAEPRLKGKVLMTPIRHAVTGYKVGAGLGHTLETLGKKRTLRRLRDAIAAVAGDEVTSPTAWS